MSPQEKETSSLYGKKKFSFNGGKSFWKARWTQSLTSLTSLTSAAAVEYRMVCYVLSLSLSLSLSLFLSVYFQTTNIKIIPKT